MHDDPVLIEAYTPDWEERFLCLQRPLQRLFASCGAIVEHIGSTAVPGLAAKPVIDILLGAPALADIENRMPGLHTLGYRYIPAFEDHLPQRRFFILGNDGLRRAHLHAVQVGSDFWRTHLAFRDILRSQPEIRRQYEDLKYRLAAEFRHDREGYCDAKSGFITGILTKF